MNQSIDEALGSARSLLRAGTFRRGVISGRRKGLDPDFLRVDLRPVLIKEEEMVQAIFHDGKKDITKNYHYSEFDLAKIVTTGFANIILESNESELTIKITKRGDVQISRRVVTQSKPVILSHDRPKARLIESSHPIFRELGISDNNGVIKPNKRDKYLQVESFLKNLNEVISEFSSQNKLSIVDLGCGHAYLTFAMFAYLTEKGYEVKLIGVDSRIESRERNEKIAQRLGINNQVTFTAEYIEKFPNRNVDITVALHACDTATDDALAWAVRSKSKAILVSPCCHHDIQRQLSEIPEMFAPVAKDGILLQRLGDILTDTLRAMILRILGYRADVVEFIDSEHTVKNLMIRATMVGDSSAATSELDRFCRYWSLRPALGERLQREIDAVRVKEGEPR